MNNDVLNNENDVCESKMNNEVLNNENVDCETKNENTVFYMKVDHVGDECKKPKKWTVTVNVENTKLQTFKIDTGAEVNTIPLSVVKNIQKTGSSVKIKPSKNHLMGYFGTKVAPYGKTTLLLEHKNKYFPVEFQIVTVNNAVLGLETSVDMNLIKRIDGVENSQPGEKCDTKNTEQTNGVKKSNVSTSKIVKSFHNVFEGLGCVSGVEYDIKVDPSVKPVITPPRRVPIALQDRLKSTLDQLVKDNVIEPVYEATEWVNPLVIIEKPCGKLRLCLDPHQLNKAIFREHYPMRTIEEIAANLHGSKIFSVLDASQAFYQIKVTERTSNYLTFNTPYGRFKFLRMPFGISSAPEVWERTVHDIFGDIPDVEIIRDEILGRNVEEHNKVLEKVLMRAQQRNVKFNLKKCEIGVTTVKHQGHIFTTEVVKIDSDKVRAILEYQDPENVDDLRRFLGIVNYVAKFIPNLSKITEPLRLLLNKSISWHWEDRQRKAMTELRDYISKAPVLKYFDKDQPVTVSVDASMKGIGACLIQDGRPVHYASRSLTPAEKNYGQIDREMAGIVFGCQKFHDYIYGNQKVTVETDHKPLEALYKKPISTAPPRIQRMMLKLLKYQFNLVWKEGKTLIIADALSRAPLSDTENTDEEYEIFTLRNIPISDVKMTKLKDETAKDVALQAVQRYIIFGWPKDKQDLPDEVKPYWNVRDEIYVCDGLIMKQERVVIPTALRKDMLRQVHSAHFGSAKCVSRARDVLYWPGMAAQITDMCSQCSVCAESKPKQCKEPMVLTQLPERPWQKCGSDLFQLGPKYYVILADYYSKFVEYAELKNDTTSSTVIQFMKTKFSVHGITEQLITDGGPQYNSKEFAKFSEDYGFQHIFSSPEYPQSNGFAESQVKTLKNLLKKCTKDNSDEYLAVLEWRNTPIAGLGASPAQLSMGRRTRTSLPTPSRTTKTKTCHSESHRFVGEEATTAKASI